MQTLTFDRPLIVGHRGFRVRYPENTLVSFQAAVDAGVQMVELDIHLTNDNELIVIHDDQLDRTTTGTGPVSKHSLVELKKLDAGSWFDARFTGEPIPTLAQVLRALGGQVLVNIEIKSAMGKSPYEPGQIEKALLDLLKREDAFSTVLISSFDPEMIETIHRLNATLPIALISETAHGEETVRFCQELDVFSFHPNFRCLNPGLITGLHDAGIHVFPYTVNTESDFKHMIQLKVDGVITDDPVLFKKWYAGYPDRTANY